MSQPTLRIEVTRVIPAPSEAVFSCLANPHRHHDFDGSDMVGEAVEGAATLFLGAIFTLRMHRLGRDYSMINYVVEFEENRRLAWEPAPGDLETAGGDPDRIGVPSGYRWGFLLTNVSELVTEVTEFFDCGRPDNNWIVERDAGRWINGHAPSRSPWPPLSCASNE